MEFIFQTTNGLCIGIGKNTTPVAKKNALKSRTVFTWRSAFSVKCPQFAE